MTDYSEVLADARIVNVSNAFIHNKFGRFWNTTRLAVMAVTDLKARSGKFNTPWNTPLDPMFNPPKFAYIPDKLADLMDARALELNNIAKATNKRIMIMWSGGIDSTAVLTAFLKNLSTQDLENVTVVLSAESFAENPHFFEKHILNKVKCISYLEYSINQSTLDTCIHLNGDPADALFGPSIAMYKHLVPTGDHLKPFRNNAKLIIDPVLKHGEYFINKCKCNGFQAWYVNKITKNIVDVNLEGVETIADWWWWHYMNFKWEFSVWRAMMRRKAGAHVDESLSKEQLKSYVTNTFYNTEKFQLWSYSNLRNHIINNDVTTHKREIKDYIFEFDGNPVYRDGKVKIMSVPIYDHNLYYNVRKPFLIGNDWKGYYVDEHPDLFKLCTEHLEEFKG